jgi:general stress protein 26
MTEHLDHVRSIMKDTRIATLTTRTADGSLTSRPMAVQDTEFDGDAWFLMDSDSDLAREVTADPQVNVAYAGKSSWLSLSGRAEKVTDQARKSDLWNDFVEAWFPDGEHDDGVVLLKVTGESAQYWDSPGRVASLVDMVKARVTGTQAGDVGEQGTVDL